MPGNANTDKFMLSTATVMIGAMSDVNKLTLANHTMGLVKNFQLTNDTQTVELTQGPMNETVESVKTGDAMKASAEVYEYTPKNLAYAAGLDASAAALSATHADYLLNVDIASGATQLVLTTDATAGIVAGSYIIVQDSVMTDHVHIAKVATATFATGVTTVTFATGFENATGITFSKNTAKVRRVVDLQIGGSASQFYYSMKVVGVMPRDGRAVTLTFPKVKITKGLSVNFNTDNFSNLPFEFTPYPLLPSDSTYSFFPGRRMIIFSN